MEKNSGVTNEKDQRSEAEMVEQAEVEEVELARAAKRARERANAGAKGANMGGAGAQGGAITLFMATALGGPVSTTHTITGAIVGVGAARRVSAVRWNVASSIVYAWVITIPASAIVAALTYWATLLFR